MITAIKVLLLVAVVSFTVTVAIVVWLDSRDSFPPEDWLADQPVEVLSDAEVERRFRSLILTGWHR